MTGTIRLKMFPAVPDLYQYHPEVRRRWMASVQLLPAPAARGQEGCSEKRHAGRSHVSWEAVLTGKLSMVAEVTRGADKRVDLGPELRDHRVPTWRRVDNWCAGW